MKVPPRFQALVSEHLPRGYSLEIKPLKGGVEAYAVFTREIRLSKLVDRCDLFVFLHETGHVHNRHLHKKNKSGERADNWRDEFEADQYAIKAMRAAGIPIPHEILRHHKKLVRELIEIAHDCDDETALKYAYGKDWRKHR
jgi:hypothetical protein